MKTELVEMTPALATKLLQANTRNRSLSPRRVSALAAQIKRGEWLMDGSPIRVAESGLLLDGQHRLSAIVEADATVQCVLTTGLAEQTQLVIDTGRSRTFADYLRLRGETNVASIAAITRLSLNYTSGNLATNLFRNFFPSTTELWQYYHANRGAISEAIPVAKMARGHVRLSASVLGVTHMVLNEISAEDCHEFFAQLAKNSGACNPVMLLSRWADQRSKADTGIVEQRIQLIYTFKSWNQFRAADESMTMLRWSRAERFPEPR